MANLSTTLGPGGRLTRLGLLDGPWSACFFAALLGALGVIAAFPAPTVESAQVPPIAIAVAPTAGWEEAPAGGAAAAVLRRRDAGRVVAVLNVVISEGKKDGRSAITDPGVAEGLEQELVGAVPGARARARAFTKVAGFDALSVTADMTLDGKAKVLRQTTVDVRRGAVTVTVIADAAVAGSVLAEADGIVGAMVIDAVQ